MDKKVMLTIHGLHSQESREQGNVETAVEAEYFEKNGTHYVLYEEKEEGFLEVSKSRIKFREHMLELTRQGPVDTHMVFEEGKKHKTSYRTPYGQMVLGIDTRRVLITGRDKNIRVIVEYVLEADERYLSDSRIEIMIREK